MPAIRDCWLAMGVTVLMMIFVAIFASATWYETQKRWSETHYVLVGPGNPQPYHYGHFSIEARLFGRRYSVDNRRAFHAGIYIPPPPIRRGIFLLLGSEWEEMYVAARWHYPPPVCGLAYPPGYPILVTPEG